MSFTEFLDWFEETNPDMPEGVEVTATYDMVYDELVVTYKINGEGHKRYFIAILADNIVTYKEVNKSMSRNVFDRTEEEPEEPKEVPLTLGVGGPVVGTAKVTKDGVVIGEITDDNLRKRLQGDLSSFAIGRDPADRYRVNPEG